MLKADIIKYIIRSRVEGNIELLGFKYNKPNNQTFVFPGTEILIKYKLPGDYLNGIDDRIMYISKSEYYITERKLKIDKILTKPCSDIILATQSNY